MGAVRVTLAAAVRRFEGKKAVCVALVSASRVRGRVTYFNADRTINTFVVATEAMFCADFKRGVDGPSSPPASFRVATNSDFDRISNTEYYSFLGIYEYRIPNNIRSWKLTNTEYRILFGQGKFTNTKYRIVLFGLNYSNTELFRHWNGPTYSNFR